MCPHIAEPAREWVKLYSPKAKQGCPLKLVAAAITLKNKKTAQKNMLNSSHRISLSLIPTKLLFPITKNCTKNCLCLKRLKNWEIWIFLEHFRVLMLKITAGGKKIMQKNLCGGWAPITREYIGRYSC